MPACTEQSHGLTEWICTFEHLTEVFLGHLRQRVNEPPGLDRHTDTDMQKDRQTSDTQTNISLSLCLLSLDRHRYRHTQTDRQTDRDITLHAH